MRHLLLLIFMCSVSSLGAQRYEERLSREVVIGDTSQLHEVVLLDYSKFLGTVTYFMADSLRLTLSSTAAEITFPSRYVRLVKIKRPESISVAAPEEGFPLTDLTLIRTALPYDGRQHFKTVMLSYNVYEWNLNDHFQVGMGLAGPLVLLVNQRYRTSLMPWLHIGLSNETISPLILQLFSEELPLLGDVTSLTTIGDETQFFTVGAGLFYNTTSGRGVTRNYRLGGGVQLGPRVHVYGELLAYIDSSEETAVLPTLNVALARRSHRWQFGVLGVVTDFNGSLAAPIPYVGYALSVN